MASLVDGKWWENPWWLEPSWVEQCRHNREEVERLFDILRAEFPAEWVLGMDDPFRHQFVRAVSLGHSGFQLRHLCDLATRIEQLREVKGFRTLLREYKVWERCESAEMEMELGWFFFRKGYSIAFLSRTDDPTPDLSVLGKGEDFVIECKGLVVGDEERLVDAVNQAVGIPLLSWIEGTGLGLVFRPTYEATKKALVAMTGKDNPKEIADWIVSRVESAVGATILSGVLPARRVLDLGELVLGTEEDVSSSVGAPEVAEWKRMSKLWNNGVLRANRQVAASGKSGIAAVQMRNPPSPGAIKREFTSMISREPETFRHLSGILVFPWQNVLEYQRPIVFVNSRANERLKALEFLVRNLNGIVV